MSPPRCLVVGSGSLGLRTALELLRRGSSVHLRSSRHPLHPSVCSSGAGGLWMPYRCDDGRVDRWALETLDELLSAAAGSSASDSGADSAVEVVPAVVLKRHHHGPTVEHFIENDERRRDEVDDEVLPRWTRDGRLAFQHLSVEMLWWQNRVHGMRIPSLAELTEAGYKHAWLFHPPVVDAPRMLMSMLNEIELHPLTASVDIDPGPTYESVPQIVRDAERLGCTAAVNCTGLGSRELCDDESLVGGRGASLGFDRRTCRRRPDSRGGEDMMRDAAVLCEESPWGSESEPCYLIPRGDVLVVGGSYSEVEAGGRDDDVAELGEGERERLEENARRLGIDVDESAGAAEEWVGFRPCRPSVRLEVEEVEAGGAGAGAGAGGAEGGGGTVRVVHNYGHGGSGWTVFVGAAREATSLAMGRDV